MLCVCKGRGEQGGYDAAAVLPQFTAMMQQIMEQNSLQQRAILAALTASQQQQQQQQPLQAPQAAGPSSLRAGGGGVGAPAPSKASGVSLGDGGLINQHHMKEEAGPGTVWGLGGRTRGSGMWSSITYTVPELAPTCLQVLRKGLLPAPPLVLSQGSIPLLAEAFTKRAIARQVPEPHRLHVYVPPHTKETHCRCMKVAERLITSRRRITAGAFACHIVTKKALD